MIATMSVQVEKWVKSRSRCRLTSSRAAKSARITTPNTPIPAWTCVGVDIRGVHYSHIIDPRTGRSPYAIPSGDNSARALSARILHSPAPLVARALTVVFRCAMSGTANPPGGAKGPIDKPNSAVGPIDTVVIIVTS